MDLIVCAVTVDRTYAIKSKNWEGKDKSQQVKFLSGCGLQGADNDREEGGGGGGGGMGGG